MKKFLAMVLGLLTIASVNLYSAENSEKIRLVTISKIEENKAPSSHFTGNALVKMVSSKDSSKLSSGVVTFEAGARTAWHVHPNGQMLIILEGKGWTQQWGEPVIEFEKGDIVWIPAGEKHWHGAAADSSMSHLAIAPEDENQNSTEWFEKVSNEQYKK